MEICNTIGSYSKSIITIDKYSGNRHKGKPMKLLTTIELGISGDTFCTMSLEEYRGLRMTSNYAKIELVFIPNKSGNARIYLSTDMSNEVCESSIHQGTDTIKNGIPEEFEAGICKGAEVYRADKPLYSGDYYIVGGAHAIMGSSNFSFSMCFYNLLDILYVAETYDEHTWKPEIDSLLSKENYNKVKKTLEQAWRPL